MGEITQEEMRQLASIREAECIGCTKCIQACPVDAILGAAGQMHTVITQECIGCNLCVKPCPVDCIDMMPSSAPLANVYHAAMRIRARLARQQEKKITRRPLSPHPVKQPSAINLVSAIDPVLRLQTDFNKAEKLYRDATQALLRAQKEGKAVEAYHAKIERLHIKMEAVRTALDNARQ